MRLPVTWMRPSWPWPNCQGTRIPEHAAQWHRARWHDSLANGRHRERTASGVTGTRCRWLGKPGRGCPLDVGEPSRADATEVRLRALAPRHPRVRPVRRSEEHTSELQSLMRISYAVFCLKKKKTET